MKILYVNSSDTSGGAARAATRIRKGLESLGVSSQMFVKIKNSDDNNVVKLDDFIPKSCIFKVIDWCVNKVKNKWQHQKWRSYKERDTCYMSDLRSVSFHGALQKLNYDILHLHWINLRFLDINQLKKINKPIVWTLHDSWPFCGVCHYFIDCEKYKIHCGSCQLLMSHKEKDLSYEVFEKKAKAYKGLNLNIVSPSRWLADCAKKSALFSQFPVTVIPNCIDTDVFSPRAKVKAIERWFPTQTGIIEKTFVLFGAVNAVTDKIKGFTHLLSALQILENHYDCRNLELLVFGAQQLKDEVCVKLPIHCLGYVNNDIDMSLLYSLADVTVVPSLTENLSCTIMESLSCGTPVCCFDIGGNGEMVEHMTNGYLAKKNNDEDLANGIEWCIRNNRDGNLSRSGRQKVLENYSEDVVGNKYYMLYSSL